MNSPAQTSWLSFSTGSWRKGSLVCTTPSAANLPGVNGEVRGNRPNRGTPYARRVRAKHGRGVLDTDRSWRVGTCQMRVSVLSVVSASSSLQLRAGGGAQMG